jgi:hypothetical protein
MGVSPCMGWVWVRGSMHPQRRAFQIHPTRHDHQCCRHSHITTILAGVEAERAFHWLEPGMELLYSLLAFGVPLPVGEYKQVRQCYSACIWGPSSLAGVGGS